jgi:hypothetical protein
VPHKDHICRGVGRAFVDGIRERRIKWLLLLGGKRTVNEAVKQTLELEVVKLAVGSPAKLWETSDRALWRSLPPPK